MSGEDTYRDACVAIEQLFQTGWGTRTPIEWTNVRFEPTAGVPYVSCTIAEAPRALTASLGNPPLKRYRGEVLIRVFTPEVRTGTADVGGAGPARQYAGEAAAIFRTNTGQGRQVSSGESGEITFETPAFAPGELQSGWYSIQVVVPYWRNATHT